jgi:glycosyltransferase involved in cell wall biosynthesis
MRVLLVHIGDGGWGGGQVQMLRLQDSLRARGVDAVTICHARERQDSLPLPRWDRADRLLRRLTERLGLNDIHCASTFRLLSDEAYRGADLIDFHCLHSNFFNYLALPWLTRGKPAVYTLHDMWPFTGHCHNSLGCDRWRTGCGRCPHLDTYPAVSRDSTRWEWRLKDWSYRHSRLTVVAPSAWMAGLARQSMLGRFPVHHIPHGVDPEVLRPLDPDVCRALLGVPRGRTVLCCAVDDLTRPLKGGDLLAAAIRALPPSLKSKLFLLLLGRQNDRVRAMVDIPSLSLGYVTGDTVKAIAYSAADLLVHPTRADNFPLVLLESLACGTPVVSFRVGGVPETIRDGVTGCLAEPDNPLALRDAIVELLADRRHLAFMRSLCREVVVRHYPLGRQVERYLQLYRGLLDSAAGGREPAPASEALPAAAEWPAAPCASAGGDGLPAAGSAAAAGACLQAAALPPDEVFPVAGSRR